MDTRTVLLGVIVAIVVLVSSYFLVIQPSGGGQLAVGLQTITVTITKESPAVQVGDIQYHYGQAPYTYAFSTYINTQSGYLGAVTPPLYSLCTPDYRAGQVNPGFSQPPTSTDSVIGKIGEHELVVNYDYYTVGFVECGHTCPVGVCSLSRSNGKAAYGEIHIRSATLDGHAITTGLGSLSSPLPVVYTSTNVPFTPQVYWVTLGDFLMKFELTSTGSSTVATRPVTGYNTGYQFKIYVYAPSDYFRVPTCGDNNCDLGETCKSCPNDCGVCPASCGDGTCQSTSDYTENTATCPQDCPPADPFCGDSLCNGVETCQTCAQDCGSCVLFYCGDGACNGDETCNTCIQDCGACPGVCGNGKCDGGETCQSCTQDCGVCPPRCGDAACNGNEDCRSCSMDCGACPPSCGDGTCNSNENCLICQQDCGVCPPHCGDGTCSATENPDNCVADCGYTKPYCGDHVCSDTESCSICSRDCGVCSIVPIPQVYYNPPAVDQAKVVAYNDLLAKDRIPGVVLTHEEQDLMTELEKYIKAYQSMQNWVNGNALSCKSNVGNTYDLTKYYCDGFATELFYRDTVYPEFDTQMGCCIAGNGVRSLTSPVTWAYASTAPDFLRTKVDANAFKSNYVLTFSKSCSDQTASKGFIYDPNFYTCADKVGANDATTGYACCGTTAQILLNPPANVPPVEINSPPREPPINGGGGSMQGMDWIIYVVVAVLAIAVIIVIIKKR